MNPQELFCPEIECPARGQVGKGNIHVHSLKDKRCICAVCGKTFATTSGTIFYRLRANPVTVLLALTLLAYGCPIQAIVKALGFDERTVRDWQQRAGRHCQPVHAHWVENSQQDLEQVQADEIKAKTQKGTLWMALAIWVSARLWMGGGGSPKRDLGLIQALADKVRQMALCRPLLLAVDGLAHQLQVKVFAPMSRPFSGKFGVILAFEILAGCRRTVCREKKNGLNRKERKEREVLKVFLAFLAGFAVKNANR